MEIIITGFDADDLIAFECVLPEPAVARAMKLAGVPADDEEAWGVAWPMTEADARSILGDVPHGLVYFLEGVADG